MRRAGGDGEEGRGETVRRAGGETVRRADRDGEEGWKAVRVYLNSVGRTSEKFEDITDKNSWSLGLQRLVEYILTLIHCEQ